ncbi:hypothetical protein WJS89_00305 [Sphingomicrobium sp. XHP0235]|uniref:hypothetical protein n=1 Tax=Sphingomicrobium aquimarinum TaxID=3133971 RepID=UPI0031FEC867
MMMKTMMIALAATSLSAMPAAAQQEPNRTNTYSGVLSPLNDSGVTGSFTIEQRGQGQIRVMIQASGLEVTDQPHVAHIHGLSGMEATCPTIQQDVEGDNDGFIELAEGAIVYGPILLELGDVDPDNDGVVDYEMTFNLNNSSAYGDGMDKDDLLPLELREIVLHGLTLEEGDGANGGEADGTAGYKVVLPVACGGVVQDARRSGEFNERRPN